jgi:FMN phosphatase YigB (HAD superfamily)
MALGVDVKEILHIGDLEMTDVKGAKNVGATAVLFAANNDEVTTTAADFVIKTHRELPDLLALVG